MPKFLIALVIAVPAWAGASEPLPLETFFRHAEFSNMVISPTGEYLAATAPQEDRTGVVVLDIRNYPQVTPMSSFVLGRNENATGLRWVTDERLVFSSNQQLGSVAQPRPTGRLFAMNADGTRQRQIYGPTGGSVTGRAATILHLLPDDDRRILIADWAAGRERPMAWLLDLDRYQRVSRVTRSPLERGGLGADQQARVRFAYGANEDGEQMFAWRPDEDSDWQDFDNPFNGEISFWGFNKDGTHVYVASRDQERLGVFKIELASAEITPLLTDDQVEALGPVWDRDGERLIGALFNTGIPEYRWIHPEDETARILRSLQAALPQHRVSGGEFTRDGKWGTIRLFSDREPGIFMMLDAENMRLNELVPVRSWVPADRMAETRPITLDARDGLTLHGLMTLPPGVEDPEGLPMVVEVHGGPYGPFDMWGWSPWVQAMASRGYLVLQINFRGSGGFGHDFMYDAYGQWGAEMQDDITDATRWAIEQGYAHPDRVCISGASYGGYAAMWGVIREPDLYRCAFAFVGVYDLELMFDVGDIPESESGRRYLERALGTDSSELRARSPVHHVDKITADLFIAHGSEDIRAHYDHYHALIAALERAGIPHEKLWVEGEGHGFYELENNVKLYSQALRMFERNIGSGWQPREDAVASAD